MSPWIGKFCFFIDPRTCESLKRKTSRLHVCLLILAARNKIIPYNSHGFYWLRLPLPLSFVVSFN